MSSDRFSRQYFLGDAGQAAIERCIIGIVGQGGGGAHIVDQSPHVGFLRYVLFDSQDADESNMNRLVIATEADIVAGSAKIELARRKILGVQRTARVNAFKCRWQAHPEVLRACDVVIGAVDTFAERRELEACCRRFLIPYIDIGMDLHQIGTDPPVMGGQVILSMPGYPCMFCLGFLTEEKLSREAANYGAAGGRPQVVWPNGVLASTAVGIAVDLLTDWTRALRGPVYLSYRGNDGTLVPHVRLDHLSTGPCRHFPPYQVGDPVFTTL
jgi:hypothetical protein